MARGSGFRVEGTGIPSKPKSVSAFMTLDPAEHKTQKTLCE